MKTKAQIIQELLDKKAVSVEDAMVLMEKDERIVYQNYPWIYTPPSYPYNSGPFYVSAPFEVTCQN